VFSHITINLTEPVCNCSPQHLGWGVRFHGAHANYGLFVTCETCHTEMYVPQPKFVARFQIESPKSEVPKSEPEPKTEVPHIRTMDL
jgi:hypothetical protein